MAMGLGFAKGEADCYGQPFLARGMATLSFDGPGRRGAVRFRYPGRLRGGSAVIFPHSEARDLDAGAWRHRGWLRRLPRQQLSR
jgi:hypothetical protein